MVLSAYVGHREVSELNWDCFITCLKVLKYILSFWCEFVLRPFCVPLWFNPSFVQQLREHFADEKKRNWSAAWLKLNSDKRCICWAGINNP